jgi:hypothetical protein
MVLAFFIMNRSSSEIFGLCMLAAICCVFCSACFGCFSIRCPSCGKRWVWAAVRGQAAGAWLAVLLSHHACPNCGHPNESRVA